MSRLTRLELSHRFGAPLQTGFAYITNTDNWPEYWPGLVRVERGSRWSEPGDTTRLVMRLLGRDTPLELTLHRFEPDRVVEYASRQPGLPDARHTRIFREADDGFDFTIVVEFERRPGFRGLLDRTLVRRAVAGAMRRTLANLDERLSKR